MRLTATRSSITSGGGAVLDSIQQEDPSLDLQFAENKNLTNEVDGDNLVTFSRASSATYVGADGLIKTAVVDEPRFDHDPATGESLGLLIEEARANIQLNSDAPYSSGGVGLVWTTGLTAPDGTSTAVKLAATAVDTQHYRHTNIYPSLASGTYTYSVHAKRDGLNRFSFKGPNLTSVTFDLSTGTVVAGAGGTIVYVGNGWYRCSVTESTTNSFYQYGVTLNADDETGFAAFLGDGTSGMILWGFQMEAGAFSTSYIPTSGSTVTRAADVAEITGANFAKTNLLQYSERLEQSTWTKLRGTLLPNVDASPTGDQTADKWIPNSDNAYHNTSVSLAVSAGTHTYSVYAKQSGYRYLMINTPTGTAEGNKGPIVDLQDGVITGYFGGSIPSTVIDAGNGWWRIVTTFTATGATLKVVNNTLPTSAAVPYIGDNTSGTLLWGAQLEEGSELTEYTPSVESFVSRASSATYVDDTTGLIKTTPVNLLEYSGNIGPGKNGYFGNFTVVENADTAPDGTTTATRLENGDYSGIQFNLVDAVDYTFSYHIKTLTATSVTLVTVNYPSVNKTVTVVPGEWTRVHLTITSTRTGIQQFRFISSNPGEDVLIWGAQLEESSVATEYIPTTSTISGAARYENGELILEEARTNEAPYSVITQSNWVSLNGASITDNQAVSPDGTTTAALVDFPSSGGPRIYVPTSNTAGVRTVSCWVRAVSGTVQLRIGNDSDFGQNQTVGTEWTRIYEEVPSGGNSAALYASNPGTAAQFYAWGFQVEAGSFLTSYIPTSGSAVTRAADVSTSALGVDSWYNQSEGTWFTDMALGFTQNAGNPFIFGGVFYTTVASGAVRTLANATIMVDALSNSQTTPSKTAVALKSQDFAVYRDGTLTGSNNSLVYTPTGTQWKINSSLGSFGRIKRLSYFKKRIPDATLQSLTLPELDPSLDLAFAANKSLIDNESGSNLITFSRASSATYVGADGLIKTTPVNLAANSEEFDQWGSKIGITVTANATTAPDGRTTADKIVGSSGSSIKRIFRGNLGPGTFTASVYLKAAEFDYGYLGIYDGTTLYESVLVDLTDGSFLQFSNNSIPYSIDSVGNGWYRVSITVTTSNAYINVGLTDVANALPDAGGHFPATGDGTSGIFVWGAQLEEGSTATDYIPTTSTISGAARFDHDPATGESLGLLIEDARTNLLDQSNPINWNLFGAWNVTANTTVAPDGTTTAGTFEKGQTSKETIFRNTGSSANQVRSVFAKAGTSSWLFMENPTVWFDLTNGVVGTNNADSAFMEDYGNGWYRCVAVDASFTSSQMSYGVSSGDGVLTGSIGDNLHIWGGQAEQGSFPTSYIPTSGSTVTRAADAAEITGTNFSSWYNQDAGTFAFEYNAPNRLSDNSQLVWSARSLNSVAKWEFFTGNSSSGAGTFDTSAGRSCQFLTRSTATSGKYAFAVNQNDFALSQNGNTALTDGSGAMNSTNQITILELTRTSNQNLNGHIKYLTYYPIRLPNILLQDITS